MRLEFSNINFNARNPLVRKADHISRKITTEYPSISSSKIAARCQRGNHLSLKNNSESPQKYKSFLKLEKKYYKKIFEKIRLPFDRIEGKTDEAKFLKKAIKENKVANCAELVRMTEIACAVNGIKSKPIEFSLSDKAESYLGQVDHIALAIPLNDEPIKAVELSKLKNTIIIDPWLGIADYAPNVALAYKNKFPEFLGLEEHNTLWVDPDTRSCIPKTKFEELRKEFPELIVKD